MQPSLRIGLCLLLLASLPFSHCIAFFSNDKLNENYLLSSFSGFLATSGPGIGLRMPTGKNTVQDTKINLTISMVSQGDFYLLFSDPKPSFSGFTNMRQKISLIHSDTIADKHFCAPFRINLFSCEKYDLTFLFQILIFSNDLLSTCNARIFEGCKKANDDGELREVFFKIAQKHLTNQLKTIWFRNNYLSRTTHIRCE